jgi:predicted nucleic acid-binding Zn finger protein
LSVEGVDVEESIIASTGRYDRAKVRALGYSNRFILLSRRAKLWAYIGPRSDYLLVENLYCSCGSFTRSLTRQPTCVHLIALREAINSERYRVLEASEEEISTIAWEILASGFSRKLRERMYKTGGIQRKQRGY